MCRQTTCKSCKRPTWAGCGAHVDQVMGGIPKAERCQCRSGGGPKVKVSASASSGVPASTSQRPSFLDRFRKG